MSPKTKKFEASSRILQKAGLKRTYARVLILDYLMRKHGPFSIAELLEALQSEDMDRVTLYRSLASFEAAEIVRRCDFGDGISRYEFQADPFSHHHHVICTRCRRLEPLSACPLPALEAEARTLGFSHLRHSLEFFGLCRNCSAAK